MNFQKPPIHKLLLLASCLTGGHLAHGAVTYVDPVDIVIPFTYGGIYLDLDTEAQNTPTMGGSANADSYALSFSEPAAAEWDLNLFFGGAGIVHNTSFQPYRGDSADLLSAVHNVELGALIDGGAISPEPATGISTTLGVASFGGSGSGTGGGLDGNQAATHMGTAGNQFESGTPGYIAFVLNPGTASETYGWVGVTLSDNGNTGLIREWAYSDTPLAVGAVPEPTSCALLMVAGLGLLRRRR